MFGVGATVSAMLAGLAMLLAAGCSGGELFLRGVGPWPDERLDRLVRIHEDRVGSEYDRFAISPLDPDTPFDPQAWLDELYARSAKELTYPEVVVVDGTPELRPFRLAAGAAAAIAQADGLRTAGNCPEAVPLYEQALSIQADAYPAKLGLGLCLLVSGKVAEALESFDQARLDDALDRRVHLARAVALVVLRKEDEARKAMATALALSPRNKEVLGLAKAYAGPLGLTIDDSLFKPLVHIKKVEGGLVIEVGEGPGARAWRRWALCKALWRGDPDYRRRRIGRQDSQPGLDEELECLAVLVNTAETDEDTPADLARLVRIYRAGRLDDLAVYELLSRIDPHLTLLFTPEQRDRLIEFIETYVLAAKGS